MTTAFGALLSSFATTAVSECGDRTFIASTVLALKYAPQQHVPPERDVHMKMFTRPPVCPYKCRRRYNRVIVFWGTFCALGVQSLTSSLVGELIQRFSPHSGNIPWAVVFSFVVFAVFSVRYLYEGIQGIRNLKGQTPQLLSQTLLSHSEDPSEETVVSSRSQQHSKASLFWEVFGLIYVTEVGDTSMIAQAALASYSAFLPVFLGACLANACVNGVGIYFGGCVAHKVNVQVVNITAGLLFALFALLALRKLEPSVFMKNLSTDVFNR
ncbi:family UPF0016 protein [Gregarina niphandrodes]|uniref:GDT1 family protein n=1 Tax=Gregarina niphandrodes TaxID=110365 RepID=A0A023B581_GRENI|nr:family UPF0016 protein [Gregarina niphandrodes]EZG58468.1 family UPF0016 protein [Gregarina niphandrodes]|eukprot:XP_011130967.1 family UPF0016 protein [Gregarina niphandrodes]